MAGFTSVALAVIMVAGGLAFFLYGMNVMSSGLEKMAGGKLEQALKKLTSNRFKALLLGAGITIALQSSSALTVMLVGLVNCGVMQLGQTIGVIMGSNIGTTFTAWLLSLMDVGEGNFFIAMLNPKNFSLVFALIGAFLILSGKSVRKKDIGNIMVGFAVLMYGMKMMGDAVSPLADQPEFQQLLVAFNNPLFGVLIGAVVTGIIQSSAASVGILQTLASQTGQITYSMAIPIIMGQNIGTCVTALISSIGVSRNAKKVAIVHISFNLIGTIICLSLYMLADSLFQFAFSDMAIDSAGIALVHTIFNVATTIILLPFMNMLEKIANFFLPTQTEPEPEADPHDATIDKRLLAIPSVAVSESEAASFRMAALAKENLLLSLSLLEHYDEAVVAQVQQNEDILDRYEDQIGTCLVQISAQALSEHDSQTCSRILRIINDFERLGDHAVNFSDVAVEIHTQNVQFSPDAQEELRVLGEAVREILDLTFQLYENLDAEAAVEIEPLEEVIDDLTKAIKANHAKRLQKQICTINTGFVLGDLLNSYERVSDHCSNIAVLMIETAHNSMDMHKYLNQVKFGNQNFIERFEKYTAKYHIADRA